MISLILYIALCFSVLPSASSCAVDSCLMNLFRNPELPLCLSSFSLYPCKLQYNVSATHYTRSHLSVLWMWISFFLCKLELTVFIFHYLTLSRLTTSSLQKGPMLQKRHAFVYAPKVYCHGRSDLKMLWKYARLVGLPLWHFPQSFPKTMVDSPFQEHSSIRDLMKQESGPLNPVFWLEIPCSKLPIHFLFQQL